GEASIAVRATGRASAVTSTLDTAKGAMDGRGDLVTLDGDESVAHWQGIVDRYSEDEERVLLAVSCRPQDVSSVVGRLTEAAPQASMSVMPGYGGIRVRLEAASDESSAESLRKLTDAATSAGASYVIESAPIGIRGDFSAWGQEPVGISVMRAV